MKTRRARSVALGVTLVSSTLGGAPACGGKGDVVGPEPTRTMLLSITSLTLRVGSTAQLRAALVDAKGDTLRGASIGWTSSNPAVARIDANGSVVGAAAGDATVTATTGGRSASAHVGVRGLAFGPFHLPDSLFKIPSFTGLLRGPRPSDAIAMLDSARKYHVRIILRLVRGRQEFQNPDSSFSLTLWKQEVDRFKGIDFAPYVADGTIIGHSLLDEPADPTNWGGTTVPLATLDAAAAYSKSLWPTMAAGAYSPPSLLSGGSPFQFLDFAFAQYTVRKGDIDTWLAREVATAQQLHLGLVLSLNVLEGSANKTAMTADQLRTFGTRLAASPYACALSMWKYDVDDPSYFQTSAVLSASAAIADVAAQNAGRPCTP